MKNFTSLLLAIIMAVSLCGCRFENETDVTDVTTETTLATTASETTSATSSETTSATSISETASFPENAVFLDEIYLELPSIKDGSYLELRNSLPQSMIDTINKYGDCYLYDTRNRNYWYETDCAIRFFPYELSTFGGDTRQIYAADILPISRYSEDGEYETLYEVVLIFDKTHGIFSLQGYSYNRTLFEYPISKSGIYFLFKSDSKIIRRSVDITDDINQHILYVSIGISDISLYRTSFFEGTVIYDSSSKEIATYHMGTKLDAKSIDLSNINFTEYANLFNYPFLDNDSNLMYWFNDPISFPSLRTCKEISKNVKKKIDTFWIRDFPDLGFSPRYSLYEKDDGTYFMVEYQYVSDPHGWYEVYPEVYPLEGQLSLHFTIDEYGRCYLWKEFFIEDQRLTALEEYICYIPEENRNIELFNSDFSYSELDKKIEEILKYSES